MRRLPLLADSAAEARDRTGRRAEPNPSVTVPVRLQGPVIAVRGVPESSLPLRFARALVEVLNARGARGAIVESEPALLAEALGSGEAVVLVVGKELAARVSSVLRVFVADNPRALLAADDGSVDLCVSATHMQVAERIGSALAARITHAPAVSARIPASG